MISPRATWFIPLLLAISLLLFSCYPAGRLTCSDPLGCIHLEPGQPLQINYLLAFSGVLQAYGSDALRGLEIALEDYQSEVRGHPIVLSGEGVSCESQAVLEAAIKFSLQPNLLGVIGPHCPQDVYSAALALGNAGMVVIPLGASALQFMDGPPGIFGLAMDPDYQGRAAAEFATAHQGAHTAALLQDNSLYSSRVARSFENAFLSAGGDVLFQSVHLPDEIDLRPTLNQMVGDPPNVIYFPIFERLGDYLVLQAAEYPHLEGTVLLAGEGLFVDSFPQRASQAVEGVFVTGLAPRPEGVASFLDKWSDRYNELPHSTYQYLAYDAAVILINATSLVASLQVNGGLTIGRQALREAILEIREFPGVSGPITCQGSFCSVEQALGIYQFSPPSASPIASWPPQLVWRANP